MTEKSLGGEKEVPTEPHESPPLFPQRRDRIQGSGLSGWNDAGQELAAQLTAEAIAGSGILLERPHQQ